MLLGPLEEAAASLARYDAKMSGMVKSELFLAHIAPEARCLRLALGLHLDGCIVGEQGWPRANQLADMGCQWCQKRC